ncbi:MAG: NAD(P)-dependent oxidoreductase [Bdellovibrionales bacterium]|nr:NAD(P)-dependent oxidoreductase [Bdellovibrionales bacterium]
MRILVTGHKGFIGSHLVPFLKRNGHEPLGYEFDLTNAESVNLAVSSTTWDAVIHLAGVSNVPECEKNPELATRINTQGTEILLGALAKTEFRGHFIFASSAQVYKAPFGEELQKGVVFTEAREIQPQNVYARTKQLAEILVHQYSKLGRWKSTTLRLFNHTHKSHSVEFFLPYVYQELLKVKSGDIVRIPVGNINVRRDIGALADVLRAFLAAVNNVPTETTQTFNVCSGVNRHIGELASSLAKTLNVQAEFIVDTKRVRPNEPVSICGSFERISKTIGWEPMLSSQDQFLQAFISDLN